MISIEKLRYIRLGVSDLNKYSDFASRVIGLEEYGGDDIERRFRSDYRDNTLQLYQSSTQSQTLAIEVRNVESLTEAASLLSKAGYQVNSGDENKCQIRGVKAMLSFQIREAVFIEIVVRPLHSGWRYHAPRDAGITEFYGISFTSTNVEKDVKLWTEIFGAVICDYVGDATYLAIDNMHGRITIYPSDKDSLLDVQYDVGEMHNVMVNNYFLQSMQVPIVHGPGRRPVSEQCFISFKGPDNLLFTYVAETTDIKDGHHIPRQFPHCAKSFCSWGSQSHLKEFGGDSDE